MIITGSNNAQILFLNEIQSSSLVAFENVIKSKRFACHHQSVAKQIPIMMPGKIPAKNNLVIETPLATPNTINGIEGGIIGAIIPAVPIKPAERSIG